MQNEPKNDQTKTSNTSTHPIERRNARRYALQALYQWHMADTALIDIEIEFLRNHVDRAIDTDYFRELLHGIPTHLDEIDDEMKPFISRPIPEIDPVELAVMRIGIYEILKRPDVPYRVVINEALELAKKFGSVEGFKFVNGLLDRIAKKNRQTEIAMSKK